MKIATRRVPAAYCKTGALALLLACLSPSCTTTGDLEAAATIASPPASTEVRPEAVGQQWVYQVRNLYNGRIVDEVTETVIATRPVIRIQRVSRESGAQADEIHAQWGMIVQDSHWNYPVTFSKPLPAWPRNPELGRSTTYPDRYQMLAEPNYSASWTLTMTPRNWASIAVPAGVFKTLHFNNFINFTNDDLSVVASERQESVWFSPEIGRWVLRQSRGTYLLPGRGSDFHEDYLQWELTAWR
jgi:hypothetical protein